MLTITVKTMDSQSRQFEIADCTKIKDFKQKIASSVNVPADHQRLIFQGRVLADDAQLTQEHDGKVIHLVQRLPVVTSATPISSTNASNTNASLPSGGGFNPAHLSQMIFQQAMNGLEDILAGGSITGNMVPNPNNPNEQIMNIQIDLNGNNQGVRQPGPASRPGAPPSHSRSSSAPSNRQSSVSAPRQQLQAVERNLQLLESVLNQLEAQSNSSSAAEESSPARDSSARVYGERAGEVYASELSQSDRQYEAMDTDRAASPATGRSDATTSQASGGAEPPSAASSAVQPQTCVTHPSLGELGAYYNRMLQAQQRLEPFVNEMINIFNTDPSFSSTQSSEYRHAARLLSSTLQGQQLMAEIQRLLSMAVIPLGRTPPRSMLLRASSHGPRSRAGARRIPVHHAVHAGMPFMSPHVPIFAPNRAQGGAQTRSAGVAPSGPIGSSLFRQAMIPGMSMRWRAAPNSGPSSAPSSGPTASQTTASSTATAGGATVFSVQPPTYQVQVSATIQPHVSFSVGEIGASNPNAEASPSTTGAPSSASQAQTTTQVQSDSGQNTATSNSSQSSRPIGVARPIIPGFGQDTLSNIFQSVARSVQQAGGQHAQPSGAGIILVHGSPSGESQVSDDMSNIVGQSVYNAVFNQLAGSTMPSSQGGATPNVRVFATNLNPAGMRAPGFGSPDSSAAPNSTFFQQRSDPSHPTSSSDSTNSADFHDTMEFTPLEQNRATPTVRTAQQQSSSTASEPAGLNWRELLLQIRRTANTLRFDLTQRINRFLENFGLHLSQTAERPRRYLETLYHSIASELTCNDVLDALEGNTEQLLRLRNIVRRVTSQHYDSSTSPSSDHLTQISSDVSEDIRAATAEFFADARNVPDVNIVESNLSLMRHSVQRLLEIIFFSGESSYDADVAQHMRYCVSMWVRMNESLLRGGRRELIQMLRNSRGLQQGGALRLLSSLGPFVRIQSNSDPVVFVLNMLASLHSVSQNQIDQFVLSQAPAAVESDALPFTDAQEEQISPPAVLSTSGNNEGEKAPKSPHGSVPRSSAGPTSTPSSSASTNTKPGDTWKEEVPPDWVETIVADKEKQQKMETQKPFSEAYIAGMPASKRRKVVS